jgi:hypothetical protein
MLIFSQLPANFLRRQPLARNGVEKGFLGGAGMKKVILCISSASNLLISILLGPNLWANPFPGRINSLPRKGDPWS